MGTLTSIETGFYPLLNKPRVYADLNGGWRDGDNYILWLNSSATESDLQYLGYTLTPGLVLDFWTDDGDDEGNLDPLLFQGKTGFDEEKQTWYAIASWNDFHNASELKEIEDNVIVFSTSPTNGYQEYAETETDSSAAEKTSVKPFRKL